MLKQVQHDDGGKFWRCLSTFLLTLLITACAPSAPEQRGAPALWEVRGDTGSAYLFGTVHALPDNVVWNSARLDAAVAASSELVLEIPPTNDPQSNAAIFDSLGTSSSQPPLFSRIRPDLRDEARHVVKIAGMRESDFGSRESWAAALMLASALSAAVGADPANGVERDLTKSFTDAGKPVIGLETAARQFAYFDGLSEVQQRAMLNAVLVDARNARASYRKLLTHWLAGDISALATVTETGLLADLEFRTALLVERNRDWAGQIARRIDRGGKPAFVAVGAGHLAGDDSVLAMLAARGFEVVRVQ